ncbi:alpha/beta hydrolase [Indiicoccus explosivorum]|uniref:alpha/beta hydrolase n=1 Tax=Indiicoccus explosivorum TaxID=1917864 RepID=UPI000B430F50|nr:esterase family protein [Indiicoccus explosivorum]
MERGVIQEISLYSNELQEEMELLIYMPSNYSPLYKYTVVIMSDGRDYFQMGRVSRTADELLGSGEIENVILVGVPYKNVRDRWEKYHPEGSQNGAYIRFLAHELVPYLDAEYPTYQVGNGRVLMGDSLAATVSLMAAMKYPNSFGRVILHSPMVSERVLQLTEEFGAPNAFSVYHVIGQEETEVPTTAGGTENFIEPNRRLHEVMEKRGFSVFYDEFEGGHTWKYWQRDMDRTLRLNFGH